VDRLWPRGISKERAAADLWLKEAAPSDALRKWFSHDPERWVEFQAGYREELKGKGGLLKAIRDAEAKHGTVTLLYSARDTDRNQAVVLLAVLAKG